MLQVSESNDAVTFTVRVVVRASRTEIAGEHEGALRVRVAASPVEGAANAELIRFVAKLLRVPTRDVEIVGGLSSKSKRVRAKGVNQESFGKLVRWLVRFQAK
jgi:uncharacterized protein (TIGR00251 family)